MAPAPFACTGCGDCCRGFARESAAWEPEAGPVLRLTDEPGLPLMSWEYQRFARLSKERGIPLDLHAFDAVADEQGQQLVVLSYRMGGLACPFLQERAELEPGPRSVAWGFARGGACGVYEHRPLACRAFPLVPLRGGVALSLHCPEILDVDLADRAALRAAYGDSHAAGEAFRAAPDLAVQLLQTLERAGAVRIAREARTLPEARAWPRVDLCELAARHGAADWQQLERRARALA
jgi:Fe-S-cluster containining protein